MDPNLFDKLSNADKLKYFWDNTDDPIDSRKTTNFDCFLMKDRNFDFYFELTVNRTTSQLSVKVVNDYYIEVKYRKEHEQVDKNPWG